MCLISAWLIGNARYVHIKKEKTKTNNQNVLLLIVADAP
jgi:hypothetical protein